MTLDRRVIVELMMVETQNNYNNDVFDYFWQWRRWMIDVIIIVVELLWEAMMMITETPELWGAVEDGITRRFLVLLLLAGISLR